MVRSPLRLLVLALLVFVTGASSPALAARAQSWTDIDRLVGEQKMQEALDATLQRLEAARKSGDEPEWTRALIRATQLRSSLHGYETSVRFLRETPWPKGELHRAVLNLFYAQSLVDYLHAYEWEIRQRERVASTDEVDLKRWTVEDLLAEVNRAYDEVWSRREALGSHRIDELSEYIQPNDYPQDIRGTVRDAVSYLRARILADSSLWRPEHQNEAFKLDLSSLIEAGPAFVAQTDLGDPSVHPLRKLAAVLGDLEAWHLKTGRREAALEARLERMRWLHGAFTDEDARARIRKDLQARLAEFRDLPWWSMGMSTLGELQRDAGSLVLAHETARRCAEANPNAIGGKRCLHLKVSIEAPAFSVQAMNQDGPKRRSFEVTYKNLPELHFRAYALDLVERIRESDDYNLLLSDREMRSLSQEGRPVAEWTEKLEPTPDFADHRVFVTPPLEKKGFYVVLASVRKDFGTSQNQIAGVNFIVTDLVLITTPMQDGRTEVRVVQGSTGELVPAADVHLYRRDYERGHQAVETRRTNREGVVVFRPSAGRRNGSFFVLAQKLGDFALDARGMSFWSRDREQEQRATLVYTDRSVYRPMQTVHWKVVAYRGSAERARYRVLEGEQVSVRLLDGNGQMVEGKKVRTNGFGSASGTFTLPTGRLLGAWVIVTEPGGHAPIRVEEYKRPTFEVELQEPKAALRLNKPATFAGKVQYYFGLPVVTGQVRWKVDRVPVFPWWWSSRGYGQLVREQIIATGTASLNEEGAFQVAFTPEAPEPKNDDERAVTYRYRVTADVTDEGGETRSATKLFTLGWVSVQARLDKEAGFFEANERPAFTVLRTDLNGAPRAGKASWKVMALRQPEQARMPAAIPLQRPQKLAEGQPEVKTSGDDLRPRWDTEFSVDQELARWDAVGVKAHGTLQHEANGIARPEIPALPAGAYRLVYESTDDFGAKYENTRDFLVASGGMTLELPAVLEVKRGTGNVGEVAKVLVTSGFEGQQLVLDVHRGEERIDRRLLRAGKTPALMEIPLTVEDRGGIVITVGMVRDHQPVVLRQAVFVPWDDKELKIDFATFRDRLRPGAKETFRVTVKGSPKANPVAGAAELLAYMYDEALDIFAPHSPPSVLGLYPTRTYGPPISSNIMATYQGWAVHGPLVVLPVYPSLRPDQLKFYERYGIGGPGGRYRGRPMSGAPAPAPMQRGMVSFGEAAEESAPQKRAMAKEPARTAAQADTLAATPAEGPRAEAPAEALRSNFAETAFWQPHLLLGEDGSAGIEFTVPDSVTGWNVWVHAVTRDLRGGSLSKKTRSVKELMVRPYLPRFLREGDVADVRVVVNNAAERALSGDVLFDIVDADTQQSVLSEFGLTPETAKARFETQAGKGATVKFSVTAPKRPRTVAFKVTARSGDVSDGELRPVPILPGRVHLVQSRFVTLRDGETKTLSFEDMKSADPTRVNDQLVVNVDAQLFYTALNALPYLINYPYECTEQTLNRFVSTGVVTSLFDQYPQVARMAQQLSKRDVPLEPWDATDPNRKMALEETPWLVLSKGGEDKGLGMVNVLDPRVAKAEREASLAKLQKAQTSSGGFPWFPGGPPSPYMTLYILHGLSRAAEHDVQIPRELTVRAWDYVARHFREEYADRMIRENCCWEFLTFLNYVASAYPDASYTGDALTMPERRKILDHSFKHWKKHSPYLKGYLALTLKRMGRVQDAELVWASVMDSAKTTDELGTFWAPEDRAWLWYNDTVETHAFALRTLMELRPNDARRHGLVQWLLINKKLNHWKSTRATAEVVYALTKYLEKEGALGARETVTVTAGPQQARFVYEPDKYTGKDNRLRVPGEQIDPQTMSTVKVEKQGKGIAFASATWHFSTEELPKEARGDFFEVTRTYYRRDRSGREVVIVPLKEGAKVEVGDEIEVHLSLRSKHAAEYVHLRDPRAAGFEPENAVSRYRWDLGIVWYEEVRDSGTNFFFEWLPAGEYTFRYRLRANMAGDFRVGPATVQSMYAPEFNAYSGGNKLRVD